MIKNIPEQKRQSTICKQAQHQREATFRVGHLNNIEPMLQGMGIDPVPVFEASGFSPEDFRDPEQHLSFAKASHLMENCVQVTGRDDFGHLLGERVQASDFGLVGFMVRSASTVAMALHVLLEFLDLFDDAGYVTLNSSAKTSIITYTLFGPDVRAADQIYDMSMTVMVNIMRGLCGASWTAKEVMLPRTKPGNTVSYQRFFRAPIQFGAYEAAIVFSSHWLQQRPPSADEKLFVYLRAKADKFHELRNVSPLNKLPMIISQGLLQNRFKLEQVAEKLGLHERTLQRLLSESGTSYRKELSAIRFSLAGELLEFTGMSVNEIAIATGYGSSSAFIRAFQKWTNTSPTDWRKSHARDFPPQQP